MNTVTVYRTERIQITRTGREFDLFLDTEYVGTFASLAEAEHEAAMWLEEQAQRLAVYAA